VFTIINLSLGDVWSNVWPILLAIFLFGIIIAIHEFGHFSFAKLFDVKVNEFSLGMGPKLLKKRKGETLYCLRLLPIGGFVSMEGEDEESGDERAFNNKPAWQRFIIIAAGAVLNLILGAVVVGICLSANIVIPCISFSFHFLLHNDDSSFQIAICCLLFDKPHLCHILSILLRLSLFQVLYLV
jgi:RIP metalloprotease RseP